MKKPAFICPMCHQPMRKKDIQHQTKSRTFLNEDENCARRTANYKRTGCAQCLKTEWVVIDRDTKERIVLQPKPVDISQ